MAIVENSSTPLQKVSDIYCNYDYYGSIHLTNFYTYNLLLDFPYLNLFSAQKITNRTVEVPFVIPGVSSERQSNLRVKLFVESKIGFLLSLSWYSNG